MNNLCNYTSFSVPTIISLRTDQYQIIVTIQLSTLLNFKKTISIFMEQRNKLIKNNIGILL